MTVDDVLRLKAGLELDVLLAEQLMGWHRDPESEYPNAWLDERDKPVRFDGDHGYTWLFEPSYCGQCGLIAPAFCPSTDIAAAWIVGTKSGVFGKWLLYEWVEGAPEHRWNFQDHSERPIVHAPTVALVICRAAMLTGFHGNQALSQKLREMSS